MTAEDFKNTPLRTIKYEFNQYVEKNHLSKHIFGEKKYEDQALAQEDYQVFKKNFEFRAEVANRYSNCKAVVTDEEKQVYILYRWVISEDDGPELQEPKVYTTFEKAASAAAKWMAQVETMLEDNGIKYECDYENWTISDSTDRWVARVEKSVLR